MLIFFATAILIAIGAWTAQKVPYLRAGDWRTGLFFGLLGIIANSLPVCMGCGGI